MNTKIRAILLLVLGLPAGARAQAPSAGAWSRFPPFNWVQTARTNSQNGNFFATDYTSYSTRRQAISRSLAPVDTRANVSAALKNNFYPIGLIGALLGPVGGELQRQIATEGGINVKKLLRTIEPGAIAGGFAGGTIGDVAGAGIQSILARAGPWGVAGGFLARPMLSLIGSLMGTTFGHELISGGGSVREAAAKSVLAIQPLRDLFQASGGMAGAVIGQALIPVPVVGAIVGGIVGGLVGAVVGNLLSHVPGFKQVNDFLSSGLKALAGWLWGKKKPEAPPESPELLDVQGGGKVESAPGVAAPGAL